MSFVLLGILNSQAAGAGSAVAMDLLETVELSADAQTISFTNINNYSSYKHLEFRGSVKYSANNTNSQQLGVRINGVSSNDSYSYHQFRSASSTADATAFVNSSYGAIYRVLPGNSSSISGDFGVFWLKMADAFNTNKNRSYISVGGMAGVESGMALNGGMLFSTNIMSSIEFFDIGDANLETGARVSLYGIKG